MSKYGVFSGLNFPVFSPNAGKYGPEKTPYLDTFHAVKFYDRSLQNLKHVYEREWEKAEWDNHRKGVLSWLSNNLCGKEAVEFQKQYGRLKSENFGVNCCFGN